MKVPASEGEIVKFWVLTPVKGTGRRFCDLS